VPALGPSRQNGPKIQALTVFGNVNLGLNRQHSGGEEDGRGEGIESDPTEQLVVAPHQPNVLHEFWGNSGRQWCCRSATYFRIDQENAHWPLIILGASIPARFACH
jgi:hypothetical protein